jgi:hypothetical protein
MRKGKDPDPYLWLRDPDPGGPLRIRIRIPYTVLIHFLVLMISLVLMASDLLCRCVEVEDDGELARRKRIEEELSQALIR